MKIMKKVLSVVLSAVLSLGVTAFAADENYTMKENLSLGSNGVIYKDSEKNMLTDDDGYGWWMNYWCTSATLFQYDLSRIPENAIVKKAEWKALFSEKKEWTAAFSSFEYENTFSQSITYAQAANLGYVHPSGSNQSACFLTKSINTSDFVTVTASEYRGEPMGTVYSDGNQLIFDMTSEVNKFLRNGKTKFNFGVSNARYNNSMRIATVLKPLPYLELTLEFNDSADVDDLTTTRYNDYILNLHLTSPLQIASGIKGGEAGQAGQAIAASPSNPNIMVCGNDMSTVYSSTDGGKNWKSTSDGFMAIGVSDAMFYPDDENIVIAMGTTNSPRNGKCTGIYRSDDKGKTWTQVKQVPVAQKAGRYLQYGEKINGVYPFYAGTNSSGILSGLYVSYDKGITWKPISLDTQVINDVYVDGKFVAVSTAKRGLFISRDGGKRWNRMKAASGLPRTGVSSFVKDPLDENHFFATASTVLYESTDGGESWNGINTASKIGVQSLKTLNMEEDPENPGKYMIYLGTSRPGPSMRYSDDNGRTFKSPTVHSELSFMTDVKGYDAEPVEFVRSTKTIFAFFDGDLHKSTDGGRNYYPSMSGYSGMRSRDYVFDKNDPYYLGIAQTDRGFSQTVSGYTNSEYKPFDYAVTLAGGRYGGARTVWAAEKDPSDSNHIIICMGGIGPSSTDALKRSTDNGKTWTVIPESKSETLGRRWSGMNRIYFHPDNNDIIYAGWLKSTDGGETWTDLGKMVSVMSKDGSVLYSLDHTSVSISTDGGTTWTEVAKGFTSSQRGIADAENPYILYMGTFSGGLLKIDAQNKTYTNKSQGMVASEGSLNIKDVDQDPSNPDHLVAGGANNYTYAKSGGIFESFDRGQTWQVVEGLPASRDIWTVEFHPTLKKVYIGTSAGTFVYEWEKNPANQQ